MNHDKDADVYTKGAYALMDSPFGKRIDELERDQRKHKAEIANLKRLLRWCRGEFRLIDELPNMQPDWWNSEPKYKEQKEIDAILCEKCPHCGQEVKE